MLSDFRSELGGEIKTPIPVCDQDSRKRVCDAVTGLANQRPLSLCFSSLFSYHVVKLWKSAAHHHVFEVVDIRASPLAVCWSLFRSYSSYLFTSQ